MAKFDATSLESAQQTRCCGWSRYKNVFVSALLFILSLPAWAQQPKDITAGEWALLPKYCIDTQGFKYGDASYNTSPRAPYWISRMGLSFWAMHHHCWAEIRMLRANEIGLPKPVREGHLVGAISDYNYVIRHSTPDFVLLPEMHLRIGDAYTELGDIGRAMIAYQNSRKIKPDYWPAYTHWAKAQEAAGLKASAISTLEEGLRIMPNEPKIREAYVRLGGNLKAIAPASGKNLGP